MLPDGRLWCDLDDEFEPTSLTDPPTLASDPGVPAPDREAWVADLLGWVADRVAGGALAAAPRALAADESVFVDLDADQPLPEWVSVPSR